MENSGRYASAQQAEAMDRIKANVSNGIARLNKLTDISQERLSEMMAISDHIKLIDENDRFLDQKSFRTSPSTNAIIYGNDMVEGFRKALAVKHELDHAEPMRYEGYPVPKHMGEELVLLREVVQSLLQAHFHHRKLKAADFDNIRLLEQYGITITKPPKDFIPSSIYTMAMQKDDML